MHAKVALRVEVAIVEDPSLAPEVERLALFVVEKRHDTLLVEYVSFLALDRIFHFVDRLLEVLFVFTDEQLLDALEAALALRNRIDLDTLHEHLDEWG